MGPTGSDRTRADPHRLCRRPARTQRSFSETRAAKKSGVSGRARVVEFSYYATVLNAGCVCVCGLCASVLGLVAAAACVIAECVVSTSRRRSTSRLAVTRTCSRPTPTAATSTRPVRRRRQPTLSRQVRPSHQHSVHSQLRCCIASTILPAQLSLFLTTARLLQSVVSVVFSETFCW